jgi:DNA-binding NtrC family response regulator
VHYRLRGEVGGIVRAYPLAAGENWIGSMSGNAIVLPVRGVSRRHAFVVLDDDALVLEDMGSKNGTLANGVRIQRTRLRAGDELRVGPVTLRVEAVDADDAALAIALGGGRDTAGLPAHDTTAAAAEPSARPDLDTVESLLGHLLAGRGPNLAGALDILVRETGAAGGCLFARERGEIVSLATSGALPDLSDLTVLTEGAPLGEASKVSRVISREGDRPLRCAFADSGEGALGLCLAGVVRSEADADRLLRIALLALQMTRRETRAAPAARPPARVVLPEGYVVGDSPAMSALFAQMHPLFAGDLPVLLLGETGVGKEGLARILHLSSARRGGPYVAVNCAAIPADLLEAEMFGIGKGIATGVVERKGKFQLAEGGTLFLDEIGDMPLSLQAKLLRALQEREIQPVGGAPLRVDIRVVAATNSDLHRRMQEGLFRRDLYYRVAGFALRLPPLRERREDIPALVQAFLERFAAEAAKGVRGLTIKTLRALVEFPWPGNIRELEHEMRRLVYLCPEGQAIDSTMLSPHVAACAPAGEADGPEPQDPGSSSSLDLEAGVGVLERRLIEQALERAKGNRTLAAKLLGISRNGLAIKMERLGLQR